MRIEFRRDDVTEPKVIRLLETHLAHARLHTPIEQVFALDLDELRGRDMHFWTGWVGADLVTMGGWRWIEPGQGEIKSMHTMERWGGRGIAGRMLDFLIAEAGSMGFSRMSLETGSQAAYAPARGLYASRGFEACGLLPGYPQSEWSAFMTRLL